MNEQIYTLTIIILTIVYAIYQFIQRRFKIAKEKGIEEIAKEIEKLKYNKIKEQFKLVEERSDILYADFIGLYAKNMQLESGDNRIKIYKDCILNYVRQETDKKMSEVIYVNNIAGREGQVWSDYKKQKFKYILENVKEFIENIWREDLIGFPHKIVIEKCQSGIISIYYSHIDGMFEEIKNISIHYQKEIEKYEKILSDMRIGKRKKK